MVWGIVINTKTIVRSVNPEDMGLDLKNYDNNGRFNSENDKSCNGSYGNADNLGKGKYCFYHCLGWVRGTYYNNYFATSVPIIIYDSNSSFATGSEYYSKVG